MEMRYSNCGKLIQKFAGWILTATIMMFCVIIIIEVSSQDVWDFGSLEEIIVLEGLILLIGLVLSVIFYGFGEIIICIQKICEIAEDIS